MEWQLLISIVTSVSIVLTTIVGTTWALAKQFSSTRSSIFDKIDKTEEALALKLEYHERHDDTRFDNVHKDIWDIRLRNAAKDKLMNNIMKKDGPDHVHPER